MAIALDAVTTADSATTGVSSLTWSHTVGAGSNRLLVATVLTAPPHTTRITGMTYGGTAMTFLGQAIAGDGVNTGRGVDVYYMVAPPTGAASIVVSAADAVSVMNSGAATWTGVNQSTPFGTAATPFASTSATTASLVTSSTAADIIFTVAAMRTSGLITYGGTQTELWNHVSVTNATNAASTQAGGTSATSTVTQNQAASSFAMFSVPILADPGTTTTTTTLAPVNLGRFFAFF